MDTLSAEVLAATQLQQASMVTLFGLTFNIYAAVIVFIFAVFMIAVYRAQCARRFDWMDMITRDGTKVSATKVLQLVGGIVGTFIVIKLTLQSQLTWDIFAIYLSYVASIDGFSKFMMAKYGAYASDDSAVGSRPWVEGQHGYDSSARNKYVGSEGYSDLPASSQKPRE
jgi:hypothetical protein